MLILLKIFGPIYISSVFYLHSVDAYTKDLMAIDSSLVKCVSPLLKETKLKLSNTSKSSVCVKMYREANCSGAFIVERRPKAAFDSEIWTSRLKPDGQRYLNEIESIGPCDPECSSNDIESGMKIETKKSAITIETFDGRSVILDNLEVDKCTLIPKPIRNFESIYFHGSICIEFHEHWNCSGRTIKQIYGQPPRDVFWQWGTNQAKSISICGFRCNKTRRAKDVQRQRNFTSPGSNTVTIFEEPHFNGDHQNLNLSKGCMRLESTAFREWDGIAKSMLTYNRTCGALHSTYTNITPKCTSFKGYGQELTLNGSDASNINFPVRSIKQCHRSSSRRLLASTIFNSERIQLENCKSFKDDSHKTLSIDASANCLNVYKETNCRGDYVAMMSGEKYPHFEWSKPNSLIENATVGSLGPCNCDPRSTEQRYSQNISTTVVLHNSKNHIGETVTLEIKGCHTLPRILNGTVESIEFKKTGTTIEECIELHEHWNCTGRSVQRGSASRHREFLVPNRLKTRKNPSSLSLVGSISSCVYTCNAPLIKEARAAPLQSHSGIVWIFDQPDFNGNSKKLDLSKGCKNVGTEWEGELKSILFSKCVTFHSSLNCSKSDELLVEVLIKSPDPKVQNHNFVNQNWIIRSIELCVEPESSNFPIFGIVLLILITLIIVIVLTIFIYQRVQRTNSVNVTNRRTTNYSKQLQRVNC